MTLLTVWPDDQPGHVLLRTEDTGAIVAELGRVGAGFARWPVAESGSDEGLLDRYRGLIEALGGGDCSADVVAGEPSLVERSLGQVEDRFFVRGAAVWYLHAGREVHAVLCEPGDVLTVPAGVRHWHDGRAGYVTVRVRRAGAGTSGGAGRVVSPGEFPGIQELVAERAGGSPALRG
ncbi:cupin [Amycolatopsis dendrobii]|uniref:Cupin n=1 Tax=Amycolatopsis dendrobii TaxID=2760662 RepID=A0A7W3VUA4_9PSEU|nr:cupin [Amycolatopsis dendrobii]MBB1153324.1 cupin [Amycolatopsis dendrobii]